MFKHVLIPTDGSKLSDMAVKNAIQLAKEANAKVTAIHVGVPFHVLAADSEALTDTPSEYKMHAKRKAGQILGAVEQAAKNQGVPCDSRFVASEHPYEAIIEAAEEENCDLIMMASHGRRGIKGLLIGSETQKVLTHSHIPVLVYR